MDIETLKGWPTTVGALIAAFAATWNLIIQIRGKHDRYIVRLGTISPSIDRETFLSVTSLSDHPIKLTDWGFIEADLKFNSFRLSWEVGDLDSEDVMDIGSSKLDEFGSTYETGYYRKVAPLGAYAITATQRRPRFYFAPEMPRIRRIYIRLRVLVDPDFLAW